MIVRSWEEISARPLTEHELRQMYPLSMGYRHFPNRYHAGTAFSAETTRECRLFVLQGSCIYKDSRNVALVQESKFIDIPIGRYEFEVPNDAPVVLHKIYKIIELANGA